jgi:hypothetical protein
MLSFAADAKHRPALHMHLNGEGRLDNDKLQLLSEFDKMTSNWRGVVQADLAMR